MCLRVSLRRTRSPSRTRAVPLLRRQSKAAVAAALEASDGVPAVPVGAETLEDFALVHVCGRNHCFSFVNIRSVQMWRRSRSSLVPL